MDASKASAWKGVRVRVPLPAPEHLAGAGTARRQVALRGSRNPPGRLADRREFPAGVVRGAVGRGHRDDAVRPAFAPGQVQVGSRGGEHGGQDQLVDPQAENVMRGIDPQRLRQEPADRVSAGVQREGPVAGEQEPPDRVDHQQADEHVPDGLIEERGLEGGKVLVAPDAVFRGDLNPPGQRCRAAVELLAEPVAPAAGRLAEREAGRRLIDATPFEGQQMVAALGIGQDGRKTILGIRQGATENATVVSELLSDLVSRGLDFTEPRLYILDGAKALTAAVNKHAGESAAIQRCQVHKRRNVLDHLTDEQKPEVAKKLNAAYALEDYAAAKLALNMLHRELMDLNPSAARSLGEGMEATLTVHRLHVPTQLRKTLASTNVIESAFSIVEQVCKNVKRWHGGDQRERWVGSGLLVAQKQFRRVTGYKQIPALIRELEALAPPKPEVAKRRKVS